MNQHGLLDEWSSIKWFSSFLDFFALKSVLIKLKVVKQEKQEQSFSSVLFARLKRGVANAFSPHARRVCIREKIAQFMVHQVNPQAVDTLSLRLAPHPSQDSVI